MKQYISAALSLLLAITLAGCTTEGISAAASPTPEPLPSGYVAPFTQVEYEKIPEINPEKAKELQIALPEGMTMPQVAALPGDGALALGLLAAEDNKPGTLMAAWYDTNGSLLGKKTYSELPQGYSPALQTAGAEGFSFTYFSPGNAKDGTNDRTIAVFCCADGTVAYHESSAQLSLYQTLLVTDSGYTAVGDGLYRDGKLVLDAAAPNTDSVLTIQAQGPISSKFFSRILPIAGYFSPNAAAWSKETGLVLSAYRRLESGKTDTELLAYDMATQTQKWRYAGDTNGQLHIAGFVLASDGVLASGYANGSELLLKIGNDGKEQWKTTPDGNGKVAVLAMAALPGGGFAAALNRYEEADKSRGYYLAVYDANGTQTKKIKLPNEMIQTLEPTADGGLLAVGTQNVKTLPQPAYVSSIWYDTETIVTKIDGNLNVQWRKVYDKYRDSTRPDIAVPAADGTVIVEK